MHLLSYRGPGAPGGLSSALSATWNDHSRADRGWWYFADDSLRFSPGPHAPSLVAAMDREMLEGHYRFCNEFLWPLMHELPQYCTFNAGDLKHYKALQASVAQSMRRRSEPLFVHDYHFALMPNLIPNRTSLFWHIPWPKRVEPIWQPMIREMSVRMLNCEQIGFHTEDYAENFLRGLDPAVHVVAERKLVVAPIGVNSEVWHRRAADLSNPIPDEIAAIETPIVLSVDRADYAKGILERLHAIDAFFNEHAHYRDKVTFVQMCAPSRSGLSAYSSYWDTCRALEANINGRWGHERWKPIVWIERGFSPDHLAKIYAKADAMLITSLKDGLNLTAKEYVASQVRNSGVLLLSRSAGAWRELSEDAVGLNPNEPQSIVDSIALALAMGERERRERMRNMKRKLSANPLSNWVSRFTDEPASDSTDVIQLFSTCKGRTSS